MAGKKKPGNTQKNKGRPEPPKEYRWKPGKSGNPSGRPKGSGNVKTIMLSTFHEFTYKKKKGKAAFILWGQEHPNAYYKLLASILPKDIMVHPSEYAERLMRLLTTIDPQVASTLGEAIQELEDATTH